MSKKKCCNLACVDSDEPLQPPFKFRNSNLYQTCMYDTNDYAYSPIVLFNTERHELARGIYIIREVYIAMFVIRIIQLTIAFNHSYHTCKFDIDWISILLKISKINANFDIIAACSSSPSLLLLPFASCS